MDTVTIFTVFLKLAMQLPQEKTLIKQTNDTYLTRTEIIEIYRNDMTNNVDNTATKNFFRLK
tara:strand:- start:69 stop:254 length:186 start_codon:yes stop_codon:yes gene_type:complete